MAKTFERETSTSIICYYRTDLICSIDSLDKWYSRHIASNCVDIDYVEISNSNESFLEGDRSLEFSSNNIPSNISKAVNEIGADSVLVRVVYQAKTFSICIRLNEWEISIASNKENRNILYSLAEDLDVENKKKGDIEMADDVRETVAENATPAEEVAEPKHASAEAPVEQTELLAKLDAVQQALATLQQSFDDKIAEDTYKNALFDNMHRELVRYQNGALEKIVDTIALDIIQLVDTTKGHVRVYEKKEPTEENYKKLLRVVKGIAEDLEDILYRQNIESYRVPGHEVDTRRQKIIQTIPTDDKSKDNLIAVRAADGYEKGDKVLRPERIKIFKYEASSETPSEN